MNNPIGKKIIIDHAEAYQTYVAAILLEDNEDTEDTGPKQFKKSGSVQINVAQQLQGKFERGEERCQCRGVKLLWGPDLV